MCKRMVLQPLFWQLTLLRWLVGLMVSCLTTVKEALARLLGTVTPSKTAWWW